MDKPDTIKDLDFSVLKKLCQEYIDTLANNERVDDDLEHYIFESALETFFGSAVWEFVNNSER
jgi:hypothetical protein